MRMRSQQQWREQYEGGSAEAERLVFEKLARDIVLVQAKIKKRSKAGVIQRAFHAKVVLGVSNATLRVLGDVPEHLRVGFARPGAAYDVIVRFSNAANAIQGPTTTNGICAASPSG